MNGNIHVQFLGEGVAATSPPYPTPRGAIPWGHPARNSPGTPHAVLLAGHASASVVELRCVLLVRAIT